MLNLSNKELNQKHLVQVISWNCIPGTGINIISIDQFKLWGIGRQKSSQQRFGRWNSNLVGSPQNNFIKQN